MQPRDGTEANEFSSSLPLDEPEPRLSKSPERELNCGWQSDTRYPRHGKETGSYKDSLKSPPKWTVCRTSITLATILPQKRICKSLKNWTL